MSSCLTVLVGCCGLVSGEKLPIPPPTDAPPACDAADGLGACVVGCVCTPAPNPLTDGFGVPSPLAYCILFKRELPIDGFGAAAGASSKPVAMTVIVASSGLDSSYLAPKMILTESPARSLT